MGAEFFFGHLFLSIFIFLKEKFTKKVISLGDAVNFIKSRKVWLHTFLTTFTQKYLGIKCVTIL